MYNDIPLSDIDGLMKRSWEAFRSYRARPLKDRARLMRTIADELENAGDELIFTAMRETNLPEARLRGERARTIFQLSSYADACEKGDWMDIRIDTADSQRNPPRPDIRKMMRPLGPVLVYGASNFPFAYSTAGGDTACALAAGCSVVVKAHPAHPATSLLAAEAIGRAIYRCGLPEDVFLHVFGRTTEVGEALVTHPCTRAVGFTGSYVAGKALFDWAAKRKVPIPVFSEMGSVNPVFLLPEKLSGEAADIARMYAASITLGAGQFCTNPGLIIGVEGPALDDFMAELGTAISGIGSAPMLHAGIAAAYTEKKTLALSQDGARLVATGTGTDDAIKGVPAIASVDGKHFLQNPVLHQEVFGPYSLVVRCKDIQEMHTVAESMEGQLTATMMATPSDVQAHPELIPLIEECCGRVIMNGVPTGVEVCLAMHHGGPFPATTDSRFSSVGADGIRRFARPVSYQNWPDELLPEELKNDNPLHIMRTVNNEPGRNSIVA
jgi:NADP-dependent aldehyde dehydrogenase